MTKLWYRNLLISMDMMNITYPVLLQNNTIRSQKECESN